MTRREAERQNRQETALLVLGFTLEEAAALRRISMTLRRWHELECGTGDGCIERDEATGKTYWLNAMTGRRYPVADRETGAKKRLAAIMAACNERRWQYPRDVPTDLTAYIQGDPRGAALYILRPGDVPEGKDADAYYSRGLCVY